MLILNLKPQNQDSPPNAEEGLKRRWIQQGQSMVIGRSPQHSEWAITLDPMLSKRHLRIEHQAQHSRVIDLGSTNGTFVNGQQVREHALRHGDEIQCGNTTLIVELTVQAPLSADPDVTPAPTLIAPAAEIPKEPSEPISYSASPAPSPSVEQAELTLPKSNPIVEPDSLPQTEPESDSNVLPSWMTASGTSNDGWDLELSDWEMDIPEPAAHPAAPASFSQDPTEPAQPPAVFAEADRTSATISIRGGEEITTSALVSRSIAWISNGQCFVVGRTRQQADMAVATDRFMSSRHFQIVVEHGKCTVTNLSETNGTWLNGEKIETALLRDGDVISAGETEFTIGVDSPAPITDLQFRATMVLANN